MSSRRSLAVAAAVLVVAAIVALSTSSGSPRDTAVGPALGDAERAASETAAPSRAADAAIRRTVGTPREVAFVADGRPVPGVRVHRLATGARAAAIAEAPLVGVANADGRLRLEPTAFHGDLVALARGFVAAAVPPDASVVELVATTPIRVHVENEAGAHSGVHVALAPEAFGPLPDALPELAPGEFAVPAGAPRCVFAALSGSTSPLEFHHAPSGRYHLAIATDRPYELTGIAGWPPGLVHQRPGREQRPTELRIRVGTWHAAILQPVDDRVLAIRLRHADASDLDDTRLHRARSAVEGELRREHPDCHVLVRARPSAVPCEADVEVFGERAGVVVRRVRFTPIDVAAARPLVLDAGTHDPPVVLTIETVDEDGAPFDDVPLVARFARPDGGSIDVALEEGVPRALPRTALRLTSREGWIARQLDSAPPIDLAAVLGAEHTRRVVLRRTHRLVRTTVRLAAHGAGQVRAAIRQHSRGADGRILSTARTHRYAASGEAFDVWVRPGEFDWTLTAEGHAPLEETVRVEPGSRTLVLERTLERR